MLTMLGKALHPSHRCEDDGHWRANLVHRSLRGELPPPIDAAHELRTVLSPTKNRVCFRVPDEGPGLNDEDCSQAARRFWRRSTSPYGGGLRLAIVQALTACHGGELTLQGRKDRSGLDVWLQPANGACIADKPSTAKQRCRP